MRQILNLNHKWAFSKEADGIPQEIPKTWNWINLPHTWNYIDGQDGGNDYYRGTCYYAKEFEKTDLPKAAQYYLEFEGANASAQVYLNGEKLAQHDGGYSTWRVNITDAVAEKNLLLVMVDNGMNDKVYPQNADFTFYGGLYRDVNLIAVSESHFDLDDYGGPGIQVTPNIEGKNAEIEVKVYVKNAKEGQELSYVIRDMEGNVVAHTKQKVAVATAKLKLEDVHLWHGRKDPYLYSAEVKLFDQEEVKDAVSTRFGCRTFEIDPEKGFYLNGESYPLRGVSRHQDRWGVGNALLKEHHIEDIDLICEMGANTIRLAHYQHDQFFYNLCDERGLVVWAEIPYISSHMPNGRENTITQMRELVIQNYNHPSIVVWGLSNEITMTGESTADLRENHNLLNDMVHEMDPTRRTTIAAVSMCDIHDPYIQIPDVVSYNHYFGWYGGDTSMNGPWFDHFHKEFPNIPIGVSEYGCEALNWHTSNPKQGDYTEEYQAYYHEELIKQLFTRPYIWATHVWNMFDFGADARCEGGEDGQNHKGLITFDRSYKKDAFYAYKAWLSDEPFVHICGKRYVDRVEEKTKITVYSNLPTVQLFVNGRYFESQTSRDHFFYFFVPNAGETKLVAMAGDCRDESYVRKVEKENESYILREKGAILNWFDITEVEGYYSLNDEVQEIIKTSAGQELFTGLMKEFMKEEDGRDSMIKSENMGQMLQMMGSFSVLRLMKLMGAANITVTKEQLLAMNAALNKIKKE